jgi:iron complex outermembrane recepter protein
MTASHSVRHAVKRALATGTLALFGAGAMAAHALPAPAAQTTAAQAPASKAAAAKAARAKAITARASTAKAPIMLAQTTAPAPSNPAAGASANQLQTIVITGSLIARTSIETPSPVQVLSAKDLISSGYTDVSDVLRNMSANGANTLSQSFSFAFATGASGISLRGLTLGDTLVLVDGERTVPYPLLDDNERSFVDLSSIPFTAIQQIQVEKDGGSALYGSDAIAGVVNVILRKEYQGFHITTEAGTSQHWDGTTEHIGFIGGHGDLGSDGYNWYLSGDLRHQDDILASNRSGLWDNLNWLPWGGYNRIPGANDPTENANVPYPATSTGYLINPNTTSGMPFAYFPGCDAVSQQFDRCEFSNPAAQLQPADTNIDLLGKFTKELGGDWQFGLQASWFDSRSQQIAHYTQDINFAGGTGYAVGGISLISLYPGQAPAAVSYPITTVPANYPGNPFGVAAPLIYNWPELGSSPQITVNTNTYRLLASLSGTAAGWQIEGTAGAMYAKLDQWTYGFFEPSVMQNALNNLYPLGSTSGAATFAPAEQTTPTSQLDLIDVHGTHELFAMPGGPLDVALGVQWFKELHDETAPPTVESGYQAGDPIYVIGTEYDRAAFVELSGNPIKALNIDAQARYDNYQTFGSDTTPKIGVKFTPWKWIGLRGTWGKGFRAPSAAEGISSGEAFGEGGIADPALCPNAAVANAPGNYPSQCAFALTGVLTANPHLKDVTSTNWTTGLILQPINQVSATVDYYNIKITNDIVGANSLAGYTGYVRGPVVTLPYCPASNSGPCSNAQLVPTPTPVGTILFASFPYENASATETSGYDVDFTYHWDAGAVGRFTGEATWTHELTYKLILNGQTYDLAGTHGPASVSGDTGNPKDRINVRLSWNKGPLTITPSMDYVSHFSITDPSAGPAATTCAEALSYNGNFPAGVTAANQNFCTVKYFLETDVYGSYQLTSQLELHASVTNLFNKTPPVDVMTYGSGSYFYPYDAAMHQDGAVGRYFLVGFNYDF